MRKKIIGTIAALSIAAIGFTGCEVATEEQIASMEDVKIGMTEASVRNVMGGEPDSVQTFDNQYGNSECWYYGMDLQVCFDEGKVSSKNNY